MNEHRHTWPLTTMCRLLQVARAGFYQWLHRPESDHAKEDARLLALIRDSWRASGGVYGSRRVLGDLREIGEVCGKHRVARIMRQHSIKAQRGYKAPRPIAGRPSLLAPNHLNREFTTSQPDQTWVTDITFHNIKDVELEEPEEQEPPEDSVNTESPSKPSGEDTIKEKDEVKTGDEFPILSTIILGIIALGIMGVLLKKNKEK